MSETPACSCAMIPRLDGAAVKAYRDRFLERYEDKESASTGRSFKCRICSTVWDETMNGKQVSLQHRLNRENMKEQD